jgi:hypothetical protein
MSLSRRTFAGGLAAILSSLSLARRSLGAPGERTIAPPRPTFDRAALLALGAAVLPSELSDTGLRRAVNDFDRWLSAYVPRAEVLHGYGTATLEKLPPSPASRWGTQLRQLDADARTRHGKALAACAVVQRRALIHDRLRGEKLGAMPAPLEAGHVVIGLLAYFYSTPEATDLCYGAAIGMTTCRPLADQARKPAPVRPPV